MTLPTTNPAAFAAMEAIEAGEWDRFLHRLHGAIHMRQRTGEYKATLVAGGCSCGSKDPHD